MQIGKYFTLEELEHSDTAMKNRIPNKIPLEYLDNAKRLCAVLDWLRDKVGPITLNCAYRGKKVNALVGGVPHSAHLYACAADCRFIEPKKQFEAMALIKNCPLPFDQAIVYPDRGFIHIGVATDPSKSGRRQLLISPKKGVYQVYK